MQNISFGLLDFLIESKTFLIDLLVDALRLIEAIFGWDLCRWLPCLYWPLPIFVSFSVLFIFFFIIIKYLQRQMYNFFHFTSVFFYRLVSFLNSHVTCVWFKRVKFTSWLYYIYMVWSECCMCQRVSFNNFKPKHRRLRRWW